MKNLFNMLFGGFKQAQAQAFTAFGPAKAKTVDAVLATFNKTIEDLKAVEAAEQAEAERQAAIKAAAAEAQAKAEIEAKRAAKAVDRFTRLVGDI